MSQTTDAAPEPPETETGALPERTEADPPAMPLRPAARRPLGERIGAHPLLAGAAAVVVAAGGAFGAGYAVGDATDDERLVGPRAQDLANPPGPPRLDEEPPGLRERDTRRDHRGPDRDRSWDRDRDRERDRDGSGSTDSGDS